MFSEKTEPKDLKKILFNYLRFWPLFLIGTFLGLLTAHLYLRYTTPQFRISTTIMIKDDGGSTGLSEDAAFNDLTLLQSYKNIENEILLLQSKILMQQVVSELNLQTSYFIKGRVRDQEIYGNDLPIKIIVSKLNSAAFNKSILIYFKDDNSFELGEEGQKRSAHKFGQQIQKPYGVFTIVATSSIVPSNKSKPVIIKFQDVEMLASLYTESLNVSPYKSESSALVLSLTDAVPQKGINILNKLIEVYNREEVNDKNQIATRTINFIDDRLRYLTTELSDVEKEVEQYKRQNDVTNVSSQAELYLAEASGYNKQVSELSIQQDVLESIDEYLRQPGSQYQLVPSSLNIQDPTLNGLILRFNELQLEREQLLRINRPDNPLVQNINNQLANLRVNILENLQNIKKSLAITRRNLQLKSSQFGSKIKQVPVVERQLIEITRQQEIKHAIYLYLLQKREESALSLAAAVSNSRIIDPTVSKGVVTPNVRNTYLYYLLLGLFVPFAGIFLKDLVNNKIQNLTDVQSLTRVPILGEVARNLGNDVVVIKEKSRSPVAEMFRLIITNLQFLNIGKENKVILITSSMSGEGKTFTSLNLGSSIAITGKKVIILSFDLRKPALLAALNIPEGKGISDYLISNSLLIDDIIRPSGVVSNLFVMDSGTIPPNPYELMLSPRVEHLFSVLKASFDLIIVDTAPVGQVADAYTLAPYIDSLIYVIRYNYTLKGQSNIINDIYLNKKFNHPMLVLNDAKKGDGFGYGYGYGENNEKNSFFNIIKNN